MKLPSIHDVYHKAKGFLDFIWAPVVFLNPVDWWQALAIKGPCELMLVMRSGPRIMIRRNIWDARIVKEIYFDKPYIKYINLPKDPVIVDVGAYIGDFSVYAAHYLNAMVIAYEPVKENFRMLCRNVELNRLNGRIKTINKGVSNAEEIIINVQIKANQEVHASSYKYEDCEKRSVPCHSISQILSIHNLNQVDLLKVDVEGGEYDIFSNVQGDLYKKIKNIVFEFHAIADYKTKLRQICHNLEAVGYKLRINSPPGANICLVYACR